MDNPPKHPTDPRDQEIFGFDGAPTQPADPNASDQYESPAYLRQTGLKGKQTRAAVFYIQLQQAD